jgi:fructokinase
MRARDAGQPSSVSVRIGVDLGGTKIEVIAIDDASQTLARRRVPTPENDYAAIVETIADLVRTVERDLGVEATVGVGTPGTLSRATHTIKNANSVILIGKPLDRDISERLHRPIRMTNDANCFALSEAVDGAGAGESVVFGAILGTGVGGGIVIERKIVEGANAIAGEWGHNPMPWPRDDERPGPRCYCGKDGCIETFLSGPGLEREFQMRTGQHMRATDIARAAASGDAAAEACLSLYEDRLARGLAAVINILDPNIIVLGGGLSNIDRLYENVPQLLPRYVFSDRVETRLVRAQYGDSSGVRGAARLWPPACQAGNERSHA